MGNRSLVRGDTMYYDQPMEDGRLGEDPARTRGRSPSVSASRKGILRLLLSTIFDFVKIASS